MNINALFNPGLLWPAVTGKLLDIDGDIDRWYTGGEAGARKHAEKIGLTITLWITVDVLLFCGIAIADVWYPVPNPLVILMVILGVSLPVFTILAVYMGCRTWLGKKEILDIVRAYFRE